MKLKKILAGACIVIIAGWLASANAFQNGDIITFDPGETGCMFPDFPQICDDFPGYFEGVVDGSYFAMDLNNDGTFQINERTAIAPGPDGGIVIGQLQPATGSHSGCPDGSESPSVDQPWCFFGNTGMQQVTGVPVVDNLDGTLDFRGWGVTWNGIPNIDLGGSAQLGDTGLAELNCNQNPCSPGDNYTIDYFAHVALGDPTGFGGVFFTVHLESEAAVPTIIVDLNIQGGVSQECSQTGGHVISASADIQLLNGAAVQSIEWTVDGTPVSSGENLSQFVSLGSHEISVTVTGVSGTEDSDSANVTIVDTTAPVLNAAFIDTRSGAAITTIDTPNTSFVGVSMDSSDICDASPSLNGIGGFSISDGDLLKIQGNLDKVELTTSLLEMQVTATDASGNETEQQVELSITP